MSREIYTPMREIILCYLESVNSGTLSLDFLKKEISHDVSRVAREMVLKGQINLTREWDLALPKKEENGEQA